MCWGFMCVLKQLRSIQFNFKTFNSKKLKIITFYFYIFYWSKQFRLLSFTFVLKKINPDLRKNCDLWNIWACKQSKVWEKKKESNDGKLHAAFVVLLLFFMLYIACMSFLSRLMKLKEFVQNPSQFSCYFFLIFAICEKIFHWK